MQLVAAANIMAFWPAVSHISPAVWITVFFVPPLLFNNFNVRRYGEFEYCLTVIKIITIVGLIILGILLPMNASLATRLLGTVFNNSTTPDWQLIPCPTNASLNIIEETKTNGTCVGTPGFGCNPSIQTVNID